MVIRFKEMTSGNSYLTTALVKGMTQKNTATGKPFIDFKLSDGESEIFAKMWDASTDNIDIKEHTLVDISLNAKLYNGALSFDVKSVTNCRDTSLSVEDFVIKAPYPIDVMYGKLCSLITSLPEYSADPRSIARMTMDLIESVKDNYKTSAAAKTIHHAVYGGLLYHSLRMAEAASRLCEVYRILDRELMICGAALHDIGKLTELTSVLGEADYTASGRLFGHSYLGMKMIERAASKTGCAKEKVLNLLHMVASHHGKLEYGALTVPATAEADALHNLDLMDAHIYQFEYNIPSAKPGGLSADKVFGLENQKIYRPRYIDDEFWSEMYKI